MAKAPNRRESTFYVPRTPPGELSLVDLNRWVFLKKATLAQKKSFFSMGIYFR
jgi:hypothetical protein